MIKIDRRLFVVGAIASACSGPSATGISGGTSASQAEMEAEGGQYIDVNSEGIEAANRYRDASGLVRYKSDPRCLEAAKTHAMQMAKTAVMDHDIDGFGNTSTFRSRVKVFGLPLPASENVSYGYRTVQRATDAWYESPGHRANMLTPGYRRMAVAAAKHPQGGNKVFYCGVYSV